MRTRNFAYIKVVRGECARLGVTMPPGHEHAFNAGYLRKEEEEYQLADQLLCPSDFVARTFSDKGFPAKKLARHQYGFDDKRFHPGRGSEAIETGGLQDVFCGWVRGAWKGIALRAGGVAAIAGAPRTGTF